MTLLTVFVLLEHTQHVEPASAAHAACRLEAEKLIMGRDSRESHHGIGSRDGYPGSVISGMYCREGVPGSHSRKGAPGKVCPGCDPGKAFPGLYYGLPGRSSWGGEGLVIGKVGRVGVLLVSLY